MFEKKKGFFGRMAERITDAIMMNPSIDEEFFEELEEILITSDIGMETTMKIVETLRNEVKSNNLTKPEVIKIRLGPEFTSMPKEKQAGKIMIPDIIATKVSRKQILKPSLVRVESFDM